MLQKARAMETEKGKTLRAEEEEEEMEEREKKKDEA